MINKVTNECNISGKLYGFGRFGLKKDEKDGKIRGSIVVLTDAETQNVVEINFLPQSPTYKSGKDNNNYTVLNEIITEEKTVEKVGEKDAISVRVSCSLSTNPYYTKQNDEYVLSEPAQIKGNFIHIDAKAKPSAVFNIDCLVQSIAPEVNFSGEETSNRILNVQVFDDYRKLFFPLKFKMEMPEGIAFIEREYVQGESYVTLSGEIINRTVEQAPAENEDMGFGERAQVNRPRTIREYLITGGTTPREFPMDEEEMAAARQARETFLAEAKNRAMEKNNKSTAVSGFSSGSSTTSASTTTTVKSNNKYDF